MSVVRTENFASRCDAITIMFFLLDVSKKMDLTLNYIGFARLKVSPSTQN